MPSRWFVPIPGLDPRRVRLEFLHAAFSAWFDRNGAEHSANDKPYAVSPPTAHSGQLGVEIGALTDDAERRLDAAIGRGRVRLGSQSRPLGHPILMHADTWAELEAGEPEDRWRLEFATPTTFRSGDRASPMPSVATILAGLSRAWALWSGLPPRPFDPRADGALWVSDVDLRSTMVRVEIRGRDGERRPVHLSCALGSLTLRCDDPAVAERVTPLLRLAPYTGVGSMPTWGLGVVRLDARRTNLAHAVPSEQALDGKASGSFPAV